MADSAYPSQMDAHRRSLSIKTQGTELAEISGDSSSKLESDLAAVREEKNSARGMRKTEGIKLPHMASVKTMQLLSRFLRVGRAFFQGDAKWKAWGLTALMLALCGITTGQDSSFHSCTFLCRSCSSK